MRGFQAGVDNAVEVMGVMQVDQKDAVLPRITGDTFALAQGLQLPGQGDVRQTKDTKATRRWRVSA